MADFSDSLDRLLQDPEVLAASEEPNAQGDFLPVGSSAIGALPQDLIGKLPALMSALGPMLGKADGKKDEKTALLLALKPYMSPERCDAIDKLIMFGRISEVMKQLR